MLFIPCPSRTAWTWVRLRNPARSLPFARGQIDLDGSQRFFLVQPNMAPSTALPSMTRLARTDGAGHPALGYEGNQAASSCPLEGQLQGRIRNLGISERKYLGRLPSSSHWTSIAVAGSVSGRISGNVQHEPARDLWAPKCVLFVEASSKVGWPWRVTSEESN